MAYTSPIKKALKPALAFLCFCLLSNVLAFPTFAATIRDVQFEDRIIVGDQGLALHGIGLLKWKYLIKVYQVALYKPTDVKVDQILKDVPKRLEYYFFVDMKASDFQDTGFELMARNIGEEGAKRMMAELEALNRLYQDVKAGQRYTLTYLPGNGLEMALDGKPLGKVAGAEFGSAYLSIWLGPDPVSRSLQEGMFDPDTIGR